MSATLLRLCVLATKAWTSLYTAGLPDEFGAFRREQIASDLWEQTHDAAAGKAVALSILGRLIRSVPADVSWRLFVAPGLGARHTVLPDIEGGRVMVTHAKTPFFAVASGIAWIFTLVLVLVPVSHSLLFAGSGLGLIALVAWMLEARKAGDEAAMSVWPLLVAVGIAAVAMGAAFGSTWLGLVVSVPMALGFTTVAIQNGASGRTASAESPVIAPEIIQRHVLDGDAIAVERDPERRVSRRTVLQGSAWLGIGAVLATTGGVIVDFLWQRNVEGFGGIVAAGSVSKYPPGSKTKITAGKFWLVHLTPEQGGPGFLALWQKCPHLGCTVPWEPGFSFTDKASGEAKRGWFRCPCHQSTYDDAGVRVFGPAPRSMDRMALTITPGGEIEVDTGAIEKGVVDNAAFAVTAPEV